MSFVKIQYCSDLKEIGRIVLDLGLLDTAIRLTYFQDKSSSSVRPVAYDPDLPAFYRVSFRYVLITGFISILRLLKLPCLNIDFLFDSSHLKGLAVILCDIKLHLAVIKGRFSDRVKHRNAA